MAGSLSVQDAGFLPVIPSWANRFLPRLLTVETILYNGYGKDEKSKIHAAEEDSAPSRSPDIENNFSTIIKIHPIL